MSPTVSVVITAYNYAQYLPEAIESVLAQSFQDFEIIIIDDGSVDETPQVVEGFLATNDRRIRYRRTDHLGQPKAKNVGVSLSKGEFIAFLDADDVWLPAKLEKQLQLFRDKPELGVAYSRRVFINSASREIRSDCGTLYRGNVLKQMFRNNFVCFSSSMVRREIFKEVDPFDESIPLAIDYDLWLRVASRYCFDFVDESLVKYRTGHANLSRRGIERLLIALRIMDSFISRDDVKLRLGNRLIRRCYSETYAHLAYAYRSQSWFRSLFWYLRSLFSFPFLLESWRGVAVLFCPNLIQNFLRKSRSNLTVQSN